MASTQTSGGGLFGFQPANEAEDVARLKAELQVEKDRHRVLVQKSHTVEKKQSDRDSAAALTLLESFEETPASKPKA